MPQIGTEEHDIKQNKMQPPAKASKHLSLWKLRIWYAGLFPLLPVGGICRVTSHFLHQQRAAFFFLPNADHSSFERDQRDSTRRVLVQLRHIHSYNRGNTGPIQVRLHL